MKTTTASTKSHRHSVGSVALQNQICSIPQNQLLFKQGDIKGPFKFSPQIYDPLINKHSVHFQDLQKDKQCRNSNDIESSLESLCIQMMEHALGP